MHSYIFMHTIHNFSKNVCFGQSSSGSHVIKSSFITCTPLYGNPLTNGSGIVPF